jgi:hypothetical protein
VRELEQIGAVAEAFVDGDGEPTGSLAARGVPDVDDHTLTWFAPLWISRRRVVTVPGMHRSRLYGLFIDALIGAAPAAVTFWAEALGGTPVSGDPDDPYVAIDGAIENLRIEVQASTIRRATTSTSRPTT